MSIFNHKMFSNFLFKILSVAGLVFIVFVLVFYYGLRPPVARNTYKADRLSQFTILKQIKSGGIVLLGDSHIDRGEWSELLNPFDVYNRGIGGDTVTGLSDRLSESLGEKAAAAILMVGFNDLACGLGVPVVADRYESLVTEILKTMEGNNVVIYPVFPVNEDIFKGEVSNKDISLLNKELFRISKRYSVSFLDMTPFLIDKNGDLSKKYTSDGIHLNGPGYFLWAKNISDFLKSKDLL